MLNQVEAPDDSAIRQMLRSTKLARYRDDPETVIVDELGICSGTARVDLAVVNGKIHGFEIKSDRDNLRRLNAQVQKYSRVLDLATLVVGGRYLDRAVAILPEWWGVVAVRSEEASLRFDTIRGPRENPQVDTRSLVELLWFADAIALLEQYGLAHGVRSKPRQFAWDKICEHIEQEVIANEVREKLKGRQSPEGPR